MASSARVVAQRRSRALVLAASAVLAATLAAPGAVGVATATSPFPPGVYGIIAIPTVHVKPHWAVDLTVECARACKGTLSLRAGVASGSSRTITSSGRFAIAAMSGGRVTVALRLNAAGRAAFRASHRDLVTTAVMRYEAVGGYKPQTDTYPVTLT